jgi:hypothetical protein
MTELAIFVKHHLAFRFGSPHSPREAVNNGDGPRNCADRGREDEEPHPASFSHGATLTPPGRRVRQRQSTSL